MESLLVVVVVVALLSPSTSLNPRLIPAFGRHLFIHEAVLFSPPGAGWEQESRTLVAVQKLISLEGYSSSIVRNVSEFRAPQQRWPLCVVLFLRGETSLAFLEEAMTSEAAHACSWLLLDPPALSRVLLPVDSEVFVARPRGQEVATVAEVYRVVRGATGGGYRHTELVTWAPGTGISVSTSVQSLPLRRSNLSGVSVRFLVVLEEPWAFAADESDVTTLHGYIPDVANDLMAVTNVSFRMELQSDRQYGLSLPLGNWTGMIGEMLASQDLVVGGPLSMTLERFGFIEFTFTLYNNRDILVVRRPGNDHDADSWQRLLLPFRLPVWVAILCCLLASGAVLYALAGGGISDGLLEAAGVLCGQAAPRRGSLVLGLHVTAMCLVASYTGQLTAFLGIRHVHVPFSGMEGLRQQAGAFRLGVLDGSSSHAHFDQSEDLPLLEIYDKMVVGDQMPSSDVEGLQRVCRERNYAYIIDEQSLRSIAKHTPCQFLEIPDAFLVNKICLGTSKDFPYKRIFNYWFLRWKAHGMLSRLESRNWPSTDESAPEEMLSVTVEVVAPLLAALGLGTLAALLLLLLEIQHHRIRPTTDNNQ